MLPSAAPRWTLVVCLLALSGPLRAQTPMGTAFTYQGRLLENGAPANGSYDLGFELYDVPSGGSPLGSTTVPGVAVSQGLFTVKLDFGVSPFGGQTRWLQVQVTPPGGPVLAPRQELTPSPYTLFSSRTDPANLTSLNASNLTSGTVPDPRLAGTYSQPLNLTNAANSLAGDGAAVTGLNADNLATGTLPDPRLSGTYSGALTLSNPANAFTGDGSGLTNLNAQPKYARTVVVGPVGTATANGAALLAALAGITTASAGNPWLLKVEPGIYDLGSASLVMKPFVDVEGSGEPVTHITGTGHASNDTGTVQAVSNSELRSLTAESNGGSFATALFVNNATPRISHVTLLSSGGTTESQGLFSVAGAVPVVSDLTVSVQANPGTVGRGVMDVGSSSQHFHVVSNSNGGTFSQAFFVCCGATPILRNSIGVASGASTENQGVAIFDSSPTLEYVTGVATGAAVNNLGVLLTGATSIPVLRQVACRASGATGMNWGCLTNFGAQPTMIGITADAFGGATARGLDDDGAGGGASLSHVRATGAGASSENAGVRIANCSPRGVDLEAFANTAGDAFAYALQVDTASPNLSQVSATAGGNTTATIGGVHILGASSPTLSQLRADAGGGNYSVGLFDEGSGNVWVEGAGLLAAGSVAGSYGLIAENTATLVNVTATASGAGETIGAVAQNVALIRFDNVRIPAPSGGTSSVGLLSIGPGTVSVDRSSVGGADDSLANVGTGAVRVGVSKLSGPTNNSGGGTLTCFGSYSGVYAALNAACQ